MLELRTRQPLNLEPLGLKVIYNRRINDGRGGLPNFAQKWLSPDRVTGCRWTRSLAVPMLLLCCAGHYRDCDVPSWRLWIRCHVP